MSRDEKSSYYDAGGIETLDIIRAKLTPEEFRGYLKGNALKYLCRAGFKGSEDRDLEKASNYTRWLRDETRRTEVPEWLQPEVFSMPKDRVEPISYQTMVAGRIEAMMRDLNQILNHGILDPALLRHLDGAHHRLEEALREIKSSVRD